MRRVTDPTRTGRVIRVRPYDTFGRGGRIVERWRWEVALAKDLGACGTVARVLTRGEAKSERKARRAAERAAVEGYRRELEAARPPRPTWEEVWDDGTV